MLDRAGAVQTGAHRGHCLLMKFPFIFFSEPKVFGVKIPLRFEINSTSRL